MCGTLDIPKETLERCKSIAGDKRFVCPKCGKELCYLECFIKIKRYDLFLPAGKYTNYLTGEEEIVDHYFNCPECCGVAAESEKEALELVRQK